VSPSRTEHVPAADIRQGDRVLLASNFGEPDLWTVRTVARFKVTELKIEVNGVTVTYPGFDSVVLGVSLGEKSSTVELLAAASVPRETR
jgi:hypothetical protein